MQIHVQHNERSDFDAVVRARRASLGDGCWMLHWHVHLVASTSFARQALAFASPTCWIVPLDLHRHSSRPNHVQRASHHVFVVSDHVLFFPSRTFRRPRVDSCIATDVRDAAKPSNVRGTSRNENRSAPRATRASARREAGGARGVRRSRESRSPATFQLTCEGRGDVRTSRRAIRKWNVRPRWCFFALPHVSTSSEPLGVAMLHVDVARVRRRAMSVACRRNSCDVHGVHGG